MREDCARDFCNRQVNEAIFHLAVLQGTRDPAQALRAGADGGDTAARANARWNFKIDIGTIFDKARTNSLKHFKAITSTHDF